MTEKLQAILEAEGLSSLLGKFNEQGVTDSILGDLTDADLKELGVDKLGERKRLLAAFGKSGGGAVAVSVVDESSAQTSGGAPSKTAATPAEATKDSPWVNTLGMPFVPIPRFETRFCIWPVRVQDYEAYCMASGAKFPEIPFPQEADHPIVGVSWNDAIEFCVWLTGKERAEGKIDEKTVYRLPTDLEWSAAVGLPHEPEATPAQRHLKAPGYPWGLRWPPPQNAGNYEHRRDDQLGMGLVAEDMRCTDGGHLAHLVDDQLKNWRSEWRPVEDFEFTSPVGSFSSNTLGIYDLGGNVWEWCMDNMPYIIKQGGEEHAMSGGRVLRGASFLHSPDKEVRRLGNWGIEIPLSNSSSYRSSFRHSSSEKYAKTDESFALSSNGGSIPDGGFRLVLTLSP